MGCEIDCLGISEESKSGDAIALLYDNLHGHRDEKTVIVIDGGFQGTGSKVSDYIGKTLESGQFLLTTLCYQWFKKRGKQCVDFQ